MRVTRMRPDFAVQLSHRADEVMQRIRSSIGAVQLDCLSSLPCAALSPSWPSGSVASGHDIGPYESMMRIAD